MCAELLTFLLTSNWTGVSAHDGTPSGPSQISWSNQHFCGLLKPPAIRSHDDTLACAGTESMVRYAFITLFQHRSIIGLNSNANVLRSSLKNYKWYYLRSIMILAIPGLGSTHLACCIYTPNWWRAINSKRAKMLVRAPQLWFYFVKCKSWCFCLQWRKLIVSKQMIKVEPIKENKSSVIWIIRYRLDNNCLYCVVGLISFNYLL